MGHGAVVGVKGGTCSAASQFCSRKETSFIPLTVTQITVNLLNQAT